MKIEKTLTSIVIGLVLCGCNSVSNAINPFYETPPPEAYLGDPNDHALNESRDKIDTARAALERAGDYQRAHSPQPINPVMKPAIVRLMWIPDHLTAKGDLVPAHYYYLKVKREDFAVQDAFELEAQLGNSTGQTSAVPYVIEGR